ncbi:2OG-Fe(II) oxygenase superfamily domain-containing protein [Rhizoctonia solani AG-1 IA]|uniref:2OG-Fe(II) oxygenase superfamily domain-containing protein n=1 Tax=Thanatephorus cucumeris (strain AG1-IA) TaxID=983506 RepID=L8X2Y4_THACA|nr:2OG-Fe(II) oxygenase superfamily domain-containing protein [Rhizoctonia solani AG-1 IA]
MSNEEQRMRRMRRMAYFASESGMPEYGSPSSSVSSLSSTGDVVFSSPALAATRENEVVDLDDDGGVFSWPAVESPAAHVLMHPGQRTRIRNNQSSPAPITPSQAALTAGDRWRHVLAIAVNRESEQANDPSTSLARRIAARDALRQSQSQSQSSNTSTEPTYPTARLVSRTTIPVTEPEPPADLRRLATTREAERQLHYRDWHRLGLLDPSTSSVAGSDSAGITPGRLIPTSSYARRRPRLPSLLDPNGDEEDDVSELSRVSNSLLGCNKRPHHSSYVSAYSSTAVCLPVRSPTFRQTGNMSRLRDGSSTNDALFGLVSGSAAKDEDTPAARSRYWNARPSSGTDNLLSLATEILALLTRLQSSAAAERHAQRSPTPATPPGLGIFDSENSHTANPEPRSVSTKPDPLPTPLESMLLPTSKQRFMAALRTFTSSPHCALTEISPIKTYTTTPEGAVVISYKTLTTAPESLAPAIERAFGSDPDCLGILVVTDLPVEYPAKRERLLRLASAFAALPEDVREKYSDESTRYSFGWSWGKEIMNGKPGERVSLDYGCKIRLYWLLHLRPDTLKGSYYANPVVDDPNVDPQEKVAHPEYYGKNIWPDRDERGVEGFEEAFKDLGRYDVWRVLASHLVSESGPADGWQTLSQHSFATFIRPIGFATRAYSLLHYFPPTAENPLPAEDEPIDSWCGFHLDHSMLTGLCSAIYLNQPDSKIVPPPSSQSGLYIRTRGGNLVKVSIPPDALAFQTGEALELATAGRLRATPHCVRVGAGPGAENVSRETFALACLPSIMMHPCLLPHDLVGWVNHRTVACSPESSAGLSAVESSLPSHLFGLFSTCLADTL